MSTQRKIKTILDKAAAIIAGAIGVSEIARNPIGSEEGEEDLSGDLPLLAALSEGEPGLLGELMMSASDAFEFEHGAAFELLAVGGSDAERKERCELALMRANEALMRDPTLGGVCDYARFEEPDPEMQDRFIAIAARLAVTYTAPSALG